jgi:vancomycin resistance protein VanJ
LPVLVFALVQQRKARLLWTQFVAGLLLLFPLLGFVPPWFSKADPNRPTLRMLSYNLASGHVGYDEVVAAIDQRSPDLVFFQEIFWDEGGERLMSLLKARYPHVEKSDQFMVASRFPLSDQIALPRILHDGKHRSLRFVRYIAQTKLGRLALYDVHPVSPRPGLLKLRHGGDALDSERRLRKLQVETIADRAGREKDPVLIAGDTNLPGLSPLLRRLGGFHDGFRDASWGFGYTYPSSLPWMRIDRVFTSRALCTVHFEVGSSMASDHLYVLADVQRCER